MSLPPPNASDRYQLTTILYKFTIGLWNSVMGSIADRLTALEARNADYQEVIDTGTDAAIEFIQNSVTPQLNQVASNIADLNQEIAEAQDVLDALQTAGVPAENVPVTPAGNFPAGTSVQEALEALDLATAGIGNSLDTHKTSIDVHPEARATTALGRAGTDNARIMTPYLVRDARLLRSNVQAGAYTAVAADFGQTITCSGTFTLALTAAATLGDGWYCYIRNTGSGVITIDPNGAETIDGETTLKLYAGDAIMIHCNGALFRCFGRNARRVLSDTVVVPGAAAIDMVDGVVGAKNLILRWSGFYAANSNDSGSLYLYGRRTSDNTWQQLMFLATLYYNGDAKGEMRFISEINYMIVAYAYSSSGSPVSQFSSITPPFSFNALRIARTSGTLTSGRCQLLAEAP